jgi:hypothetical protein
MKRKGYFWILILSGVIFLGCFLFYLVYEKFENLSQEEVTMIDFAEQTEQSASQFWDNLAEAIEDTNQIGNKMYNVTQKDVNLTDIDQVESKVHGPAEEDMNLTDTDQAESKTVILEVQEEFYSTTLTEELMEYITGKSYPDTTEPIQISYDVLAYVHILHYDFEGQVQEGELICNQAIAQDLVDIFRTLYEHQYAIEKVRLIDEYDADDELSMADNNTSCFNYRTVPGKTKLSNHSYGYAIDINPLYNPYVRTRNGTELISPDNGAVYADRSADFPHKIDREDLCYKLFIEHGFQWGGAWNSSKDYQHFEKTKNH